MVPYTVFIFWYVWIFREKYHQNIGYLAIRFYYGYEFYHHCTGTFACACRLGYDILANLPKDLFYRNSPRVSYSHGIYA